MSQENVELVRQGIEAWNRGDLDWLLDRFTPDSEFHTAALPRYRARLPGARGVSAVLAHVPRALGDPTLLIEVERIEPIGDDRVLGLLWFHGRGRDGLDVRLKYANLYTVEGGMVSRLVGFADWQQGLQAAGLGG
jgi:ketosteroid isomerase-like protein